MTSKNYVSLHTHTTYSILDGITKRDELIKLTKEYGMPGLSITEHGNLFNCISFYRDCMKAGIVPIIGYEAYVAPDSRHNRVYSKKGEAEEDARNGDLTLYAYHLTILAKNRQGYENLRELSTLAYKEGFYKKPRVDDELLERHKEGLIVLSGCLASKVSRLVIAGNKAAAIAEIDKLRQRHGENFYLEIMDHNIEEERVLAEALLDISKTHGIPVVMTGDTHFAFHGDELAHTVALNMGGRKTLSSDDKWVFNGSGYWYKTPEEMYQSADNADIPHECLTNTLDICKSVEDYGFKLASTTKKFTVPLFREHNHVYTNEECDQLLEFKVWQGLSERGLSDSEPHRARVMEELDVIKRKGFSSYFLIIADIVDFMRKNDIIVPIGRGSSLGSLVCYCTFITGLDPVEHAIPFERFINEGRKDLPDVDTDISQENRHKVLEYIVGKYGKDHVAHIVTFQSLRAKAAIDNVGRVLDVPSSVRRQATADIHDDPTSDETVTELVEATPTAKAIIDQIPNWLDVAQRLEGNNRHVGSHSAGIVISNTPLGEAGVPLMRPADDGIVTTQLDMFDVAELGLLKLDMLGLKTLDVIHNTLKQVRDQLGVTYDWHKIDLQDKAAYDLISTGKYVSVFQYDSAGMRNLNRQLLPENFDHLVAINCLYRPGCLKKPAGGGQSILEMYLDRRHGRAPIEYWHPELESSFKPTLGLCLFQENLMDVARIISGFDRTEADEYRAAVGKKDVAKFTEAQNKLIQRGIQMGRDPAFMRSLADKVSGFARYGWNKAHAKAYSYVSYVTAWLEARYPTYYYTSLLNSAADDSDKLSVLIAAIIQRGYKLREPDINKSALEFSTDGHEIYMGLSSIKQVGDRALADLLQVRKDGPFTSYLDFHERTMKYGMINLTVKGNLIKAGAFKFDTSMTTKDKLENCEPIQSTLKKFADKLGLEKAREKVKEKIVLTGTEYNRPKLLELEKSALNYYISSHPVSEYSRMFSLFHMVNFTTPSQLQHHSEDEHVVLLGTVAEKQVKPSKNGSMYLTLKVSDSGTSNTFRIWSPLGPQLAPQLTKDQLVLISGTTYRDSFLGGDISIRVRRATPINMTSGFPIKFMYSHDEAELNSVAAILGANVGAIRQTGGRYVAELKTNCYLKPEHVDFLRNMHIGYGLDI